MELEVSTANAPIPVLTSVSDLATTSEAWLVDVWGVIHNGVAAFESSGNACAAYRQQGGYVVLLTNAPRPAEAVVEQLDRIGVRRDAYDAVLTSGDVTRGLVKAWSDKPLCHIGPERDLGIFEDLGTKFTTTLDAEIVVCTGLMDDETETPDDYANTLAGFKRRNLVMLCANPDLKVERGDRIVYCAGAIAQAYEQLGGEVVYSGKPYLPIYDLALGMIRDGLGRDVPKDRVLAVGDGLLTDIKGASAAGIRSLFIASGIHVPRASEFDEAMLLDVFGGYEHTLPVAGMRALTW